MNHLRKPHLCATGHGCMVTVGGGELGCAAHNALLTAAESDSMRTAWKADDATLEAVAGPIVSRIMAVTREDAARADAELDERERRESMCADSTMHLYEMQAKASRDAEGREALVRAARTFLEGHADALHVVVEAHYCDADNDEGTGVRSWMEVYTRVPFRDGAVFYKEEVRDGTALSFASDAYYGADGTPGPVVDACLALEEAMRDRTVTESLELDRAVIVTRDDVTVGSIEPEPAP